MSVAHVNDGDLSEAESAVSAPQPGDRRRYYMDGSRLDGALWAAGYRLCSGCGGLTIHRTVCLRCDPVQSLTPAALPAAPAHCTRCNQAPILDPFDVCQSCRADDLMRERVAARRVPAEDVA